MGADFQGSEGRGRRGTGGRLRRIGMDPCAADYRRSNDSAFNQDVLIICVSSEMTTVKMKTARLFDWRAVD